MGGALLRLCADPLLPDEPHHESRSSGGRLSQDKMQSSACGKRAAGALLFTQDQTFPLFHSPLRFLINGHLTGKSLATLGGVEMGQGVEFCPFDP